MRATSAWATATGSPARPGSAIALDELARTLDGLSAAEVLVVGEALARALADAHRGGIVHGGVDPHNVLLTAAGEPTLVYRSAAAEFQPPEVSADDGPPTAATDVYGLGTVLHFGLTGAPPAGRAGVGTDALSVLVSDLLQADPASRPDAATAAERLAALLAAERPPPTVRPPRRQAKPLIVLRPERPPSPRRLVLTTAAVVIGVALAGIGLALSQSGPAGRPSAAMPVDPHSEGAQRPPAEVTAVELKAPRDDGDSVRLQWRSAEDLDFAVVVAVDGGSKPKVLLAQRERSIRIPVEPGKQYCFLVQATDGSAVYETDPRAIRGARCGT